MKKLGIFASVLLAFGLLAACEKGGDQIAFVDVQKVIRDSKVGKDLNRQIKDYGDSFSKKARPEQERLEKEQKDLVDQQRILSAAAFRGKETAFREKVARFQQKMRTENQRLQKGGQESLATVEDVLAQIYKELLDKHGLDIIVNRGMVLDGKRSTDLTDEVIELLDARLSSVKLEVPKE